jgi:hypothetical protein
MRPSLLSLLLTLSLHPAAGMSQDAEEISLAEIEKNCQQWAEEDGIEPEEIDEYLADCRRLEAESYGLESNSEDMDDTAAPVIDPGQ